MRKLRLDNDTFSTWGFIQQVTPDVRVLFEGDSDLTTVTLGPSGYSPTIGDKVALLKLGMSWVIISDLSEL